MQASIRNLYLAWGFALISIVTMFWCCDAQAQVLDLETGLTESILDMTTTEQRNLFWTPCEERFRGNSPEARSYARFLAQEVIQAAQDDLDPWWMVAQLMQESGMNPCASSAERALRRELGRAPTRRELLQHVRENPTDLGIAQFRWVGRGGWLRSRYNVEDPATLLDPEVAIPLFAAVLRSYRTHCDRMPIAQGTRLTRSGRVIRWRYRCEDVYWAIHNTGSFVRDVYVRSVRTRYRSGPERWRERVDEMLLAGG